MEQSSEVQVLKPEAFLLTRDDNETCVLHQRNEGYDEQSCFNEAG